MVPVTYKPFINMRCYSYYFYYSLRLNSSLMILPQIDLVSKLILSNHHVPWYMMHASIPALHSIYPVI